MSSKYNSTISQYLIIQKYSIYYISKFIRINCRQYKVHQMTFMSTYIAGRQEAVFVDDPKDSGWGDPEGSLQTS